MLSQISKRNFQKQVLDHYKKHGRSFPWRDTFEPYAILVSEFMLQQTQTARVIPKYVKFLEKFPSFQHLARARLSRVLKIWQGLGYNRRARHLHELARVVMKRHGGKLPNSTKELEALPGVGPYTARAVMTFAHKKSEALIETNIRSVYLHHFFLKSKTKVSDKIILQCVENTLYHRDVRIWYYALMDYGAMLKQQGFGHSQKSAHYKVQTPFAGSMRQLRGQILKLSLTQRRCSLSFFSRSLKRPRAQVSLAISSLVRDGLLIRDGKSLMVT